MKPQKKSQAFPPLFKRPPEDPSMGAREERIARVLTQGAPAMVQSIVDAVVIKNQNIFLLTRPDGRVPLGGGWHGLGLYYHDCRFLNGYDINLSGTEPTSLAATASKGYMALLQLTNPDLRTMNGRLIRKEEIGIKWERVIDPAELALHDSLSFQNFTLDPIDLPVSLRFSAAFEDIFAVRELLPEHPGKLFPPAWENGALHFAYQGSDGNHRSLSIHFSESPEKTEPTAAHFKIVLAPREIKPLRVSFFISESPDRNRIGKKARRSPNLQDLEASVERAARQWISHYTQVESDSLLLNSILDRSFRDLGILRSRLGDKTFFAAGIPWFATLFGRDSLITSIQTLAFDPTTAEETLRLLARHQGDRVDDWRDEEPGKILHEFRFGELARVGAIPHAPYYGTVDATPLFLILLGRHAAWTGALTLFHDLRRNIERALEWISRYGDKNGDGYVEYRCRSKVGLVNQGWKDSGDAVVNADGSLADPPISLVEVQGYVYLAKKLMSDLYRRAGEPERADSLRREAEALQHRFNRDFWLEEIGFYALALQEGGRPAAVVSSNPGHALWSGIADPEKAQRTMERMMADDMFTGWGTRTLSSRERRYNPIGYHLGTVWPHDTAFAAAGFRKYGFDEAARKLFTALSEAAMHFEGDQLPELFSGFQRDEYAVPVRYPVACHPQAWAAGAIPSLLENALGLTPEGFEGRLRIVRPILPGFIKRVEVRRLRVGLGSVDLRFQKTGAGEVKVEALQVDGKLDVVIDTQ